MNLSACLVLLIQFQIPGVEYRPAVKTVNNITGTHMTVLIHGEVEGEPHPGHHEEDHARIASRHGLSLAEARELL